MKIALFWEIVPERSHLYLVEDPPTDLLSDINAAAGEYLGMEDTTDAQAAALDRIYDYVSTLSDKGPDLDTPVDRVVSMGMVL